MKTEDRLSQEDIQALVENPDTETKIRVIEKLSGQYNTNEFTEAQVALAEQIFRLLLRQAEIEVRKTLSENLMSSTVIPHDVVFSLARDVEEVALPVLEFSEVLTDNDLVEIIQSTEKVAAQVAIAKRQTVSEAVSAVLVDTSVEEVVGTLVDNEGAEISEESYTKVVDDFSDSETIVDSMITRGSVPSTVIEQMTHKVSEVMQQKLEKKYKNSFKDINAFFQESSEVAAFKFMGMQMVDKELMELVDDLEKHDHLEAALDSSNGMLSQLLDGLDQLGKLTPLSALAMGHQPLFEISLSRIADKPFGEIKKVVEGHEEEFTALYDYAQLPPKLLDAVRFVLETISEMDESAKMYGTPRAKEDLYLFMKHLVNGSNGKNIRNLAHFISIIRRHLEEK